ncbi:hypothetical protein RCL1_008588 [Eukaryota sp. TZLM3-RCL]
MVDDVVIKDKISNVIATKVTISVTHVLKYEIKHDVIGFVKETIKAYLHNFIKVDMNSFFTVFKDGLVGVLSEILNQSREEIIISLSLTKKLPTIESVLKILTAETSTRLSNIINEYIKPINNSMNTCNISIDDIINAISVPVIERLPDIIAVSLNKQISNIKEERDIDAYISSLIETYNLKSYIPELTHDMFKTCNSYIKQLIDLFNSTYMYSIENDNEVEILNHFKHSKFYDDNGRFMGIDPENAIDEYLLSDNDTKFSIMTEFKNVIKHGIEKINNLKTHVVVHFEANRFMYCNLKKFNLAKDDPTKIDELLKDVLLMYNVNFPNIIKIYK